MEIKIRTVLIVGAICLLVGVGAGLAIALGISSDRIGRLDSAIAGYQSTVADLQRANIELDAQNKLTTEKWRQLRNGIGEVASIAEKLPGQGSSIAEKLTGVIEALRKVSKRLHELQDSNGSVGGNIGWSGNWGSDLFHSNRSNEGDWWRQFNSQGDRIFI